MNKIYNYVKKMLFIMAAVITLTSLTVPARSYAAEVAVTEGKVEIVSAMSGNRLIDTKKSQKYENGASIAMYGRNDGGTYNQQWILEKQTNGWYLIRSAGKNDMVLDVKGGTKQKGTPVWLYKKNGTDAQLWKFESAGDNYYYIKSKLGYYLDVKGNEAKNGVALQIWNLNKGANQKFKFNMIETKSVTQKREAFLKDSRFKNGATYGARKPYLSSYSCSGCCAYTADLVKYVYGKSSPRAGKAFYKASDIRSGDVIRVVNSQHWLFVYARDGKTLYTSEGNWGGKVVVSSSTYTIEDGKLYRNGKVFRTFSVGYHFN